ncbi:MAG: STAS domain-containing protein [Planctomycetaceae bacterium]|nr:STAS domain-containing protein [Planctomycetaceae bacterium]
MPQPPQTLLHRVYLVDVYGDTLVVTPRGDAAGFSVQAVHSEMTTITALVQSPAVQHLLFDLSGGNYFGSVILGSQVQLGQIVRNRGGRIGLCGASTDMQEVLRLMKLDQLWEMFPSLKAGLNAVAAIPLGERLWRKRRAFAVLAVIVVVALTYLYFPRTNYASLNYQRLNALWQEVESRREMAGEDEWSRLQKRVEKELEPIVADMERRGKEGLVSMPERFLVYVARDNWPSAMDRSSPHSDFHRRMVQHNFRVAEAMLEGRPVPSLFVYEDPDKPATHQNARVTPATPTEPTAETGPVAAPKP